MNHVTDDMLTQQRVALELLSTLLPGQVSLPDDPGFDEQRSSFNLLIDQQPMAVVMARNQDDIVAVVRLAARHELSVAMQPTGHGATQALDGTILLRTRALDQITVDTIRRTARIGAGVNWQELLDATSDHGLTGLAGSSGAPSVVGYTLGGGLSWFGRAFGLAESSVNYFDIVDATGQARRVDASRDADLFWAMRGGGGDFAAVVAMEINLYPVPHLCAGRMLWPIEMAQPVLRAFADTTRHAPDELTIWAQLLQFPDLPQLPENLRGGSFVTIDVAFIGEAEDAEPHLAPFRRIPAQLSDSVGPLALRDLETITAEPDQPAPSLLFARLLTHLDGGAITALLHVVGRGSGSKVAMVQLRHLGGALATDGDGPAGVLDDPYQLFCLGIPVTPEMGADIELTLAETAVAIQDYLSERVSFNFLAADENPTRAFSGDSMTRLQQIKRQYDPKGVFTSNYPVLTPRG